MEQLIEGAVGAFLDDLRGKQLLVNPGWTILKGYVEPTKMDRAVADTDLNTRVFITKCKRGHVQGK